MHDRTGCKGFLGEAFCMFDKGTNTVDLFAQVVHARAEDSSLDLDRVGITRQDGVNAYRVAVSNAEIGIIEFSNIKNSIFSACLAIHTHGLGIGISCKSTSILQYGIDTLVLLHFVEHRAFYLSADVDKAVVWSYHDDIIISQANVTCQFAVEDIVVDIYYGYKSVVTINLDVT